MLTNSAGIITARDGLVIGRDRLELAQRLERFSTATGDHSEIYEKFGFSESKRFDLSQAQSELRALASLSEPIRSVLYRPFDERVIFFHPSVVWSLARPMADQMVGGDNLALIATRQVTRPRFEHAYVSRHMIEIKACSHDRNTQIFPLFIRDSKGGLPLASSVDVNLKRPLLEEIAQDLGLQLNVATRDRGDLNELTPRRIFEYTYAVLYCRSYRERYFEFLRSDFPRLPAPKSANLFRTLAELGAELVALHLMESPKLDDHITTPVGSGGFQVEKISYSDGTVWIDKANRHGFRGVPEEVWDFRIGGYQVCDKWLKDRRGGVLSEEDIRHYQRIVVALKETIRLMGEIDEVIEAHGGWPLPGSVAK